MTTQTSKPCKHYDCGWCYAPADSQSNDHNGACMAPDKCEEYKKQGEEEDDG